MSEASADRPPGSALSDSILADKPGPDIAGSDCIRLLVPAMDVADPEAMRYAVEQILANGF